MSWTPDWATSIGDKFQTSLADLWTMIKNAASRLANARGKLEMAKSQLEPKKYQELVSEYNSLSNKQMTYETEIRDKMLEEHAKRAGGGSMNGLGALGIPLAIPIVVVAGSVAVAAYAAAKYKEHSAAVELFEAKVKAATAGLDLPDLNTNVALAQAGQKTGLAGLVQQVPFWVWLIGGAVAVLYAKKRDWI